MLLQQGEQLVLFHHQQALLQLQHRAAGLYAGQNGCFRLICSLQPSWDPSHYGASEGPLTMERVSFLEPRTSAHVHRQVAHGTVLDVPTPARTVE